MKRFLFLAFLFASINSLSADEYFPDGYCFPDPGGLDVGMPEELAGKISGFDINKLCLQYDEVTDTLFVGVETFNSVIFGDVDGNGDPSAPAETDPADIGNGEFFSFIMDFDNDLSNGVSFVAGVPFQNDVYDFLISYPANSTAALPLSFDESYYGSLIETSAEDNGVSFNPDAENPYLDLAITNVSQIKGFDAINFDDPNYFVGIYFYTGNLLAGTGQDCFGDCNALNPMKLADILYGNIENGDGTNNDTNNDATNEENDAETENEDDVNSDNPDESENVPEEDDADQSGTDNSGNNNSGGTDTSCSLIKGAGNNISPFALLFVIGLAFPALYNRTQHRVRHQANKR